MSDSRGKTAANISRIVEMADRNPGIRAIIVFLGDTPASMEITRPNGATIIAESVPRMIDTEILKEK